MSDNDGVLARLEARWLDPSSNFYGEPVYEDDDEYEPEPEEEE